MYVISTYVYLYVAHASNTMGLLSTCGGGLQNITFLINTPTNEKTEMYKAYKIHVYITRYYMPGVSLNIVIFRVAGSS